VGYDEIRGIGGAIGLVMLFIGFIGVIAYALWPGNRNRFDRAAKLPLEDDAPKGDMPRKERPSK
jgi:cytochrome c oxidase cbb3-type subunit 4